MRAVELRIMFEDDDGKTWSKTYRSGDPRIARRLDEAVRDAILEVDPEARGLSSVGPVLRRVTEVCGAFVPGVDEASSLAGYDFDGALLPAEFGGGEYDIRIEVTATVPR